MSLTGFDVSTPRPVPGLSLWEADSYACGPLFKDRSALLLFEIYRNEVRFRSCTFRSI
jgi:hypothetical protein